MNREITSTLWPLEGDVFTQAGDRFVRVIGLNGVPLLISTLVGGETLVFNNDLGRWTAIIEDILFVNGRPSGDDPYMSVNAPKIAHVNGV